MKESYFYSTCEKISIYNVLKGILITEQLTKNLNLIFENLYI